MADRYLNPGTYSGSVAFTNTALWLPTGTPATGDNLYCLMGGGLTFDQDIDQHTVLLASLITGENGPQFGSSGTNYFKIGATIQLHGVASTDGRTGPGSGRLKIDSGTNPTTINVLKTASQSTDSGIPAACFLGSSAANVLNVSGGNVGIAAAAPTDQALWGTISNGGSSSFVVGKGVTYTTFNSNNQNASTTLQAGGNSVTVNSISGNWTTQGTFTLGVVNSLGGIGTLNHRPTSGTMVGTLNLQGGTIDMRGNPTGFSFNNTAYTSGNLYIFDDGQQTLGTVTLPFSGNTKKSMTNAA